MTSAARLRAAAGLLVLLAGPGWGQETRPPRLELRVASEGWGSAPPRNIEAVLRSASDTLLPFFPGLDLPVIEVSRSRENPITLYERGPSGEIRVKLDVEGLLWARFAFQFSHELGHVLCGVQEYPNPNLWFEESLCEVASLYALARMSETWSTRPPYENWRDYAPQLKKYRDERIEGSGEKLPPGVTLEAWFREKEPKLRENPHLRAANLTIAAALLPAFEEAPEHWEALKSLNTLHGDARRPFSRYLGDWSRSSAEKHRPFIRSLAGRLGATVDP
ncbi:MAG TPA: hypothetical protein VKW04_15845 [Planctomycetota bacterium]|nr:hypothetical protein [Planctomycetota bacterium]